MTNTMMKVGGVGCLIWAIAAVFIAIAGIGVLAGGFSQTWFWVYIAGSMIAATGIILTGIGGFGLRKQYSNILPLIGGIIGIIGGVIVLITDMIQIAAPMNWLWIPDLIAWILVSIFLLLLAVSFIMIRQMTGKEGICIGASMLCLIPGISLIVAKVLGIFATTGIASLWTELVTWFVIIPAMIMAMMIFFKGK